MNSKEFMEYARDRVIGTAFEIDVYDLETLFNSGKSTEEIYDYLEKNLDNLAEERGLNPNRQDQMVNI